MHVFLIERISDGWLYASGSSMFVDPEGTKIPKIFKQRYHASGQITAMVNNFYNSWVNKQNIEKYGYDYYMNEEYRSSEKIPSWYSLSEEEQQDHKNRMYRVVEYVLVPHVY